MNEVSMYLKIEANEIMNALFKRYVEKAMIYRENKDALQMTPIKITIGKSKFTPGLKTESFTVFSLEQAPFLAQLLSELTGVEHVCINAPFDAEIVKEIFIVAKT
jgi:hypothetical protein